MIPEKGNSALKWIGNPGDFATTLARATDAHFTWIGPYCPALEPATAPDFIARCQTLVRRIGYQFRLLALRHDAVQYPGGPLTVTLSGVNEGIAPFYYPWQVHFALIDARGRVAIWFPFPRVDIRTWQPGIPFTIAVTPMLPNLSPGRYTLALGILDPLISRPAIAFANRLPPRTAEGWQPVSTLTVEKQV